MNVAAAVVHLNNNNNDNNNDNNYNNNIVAAHLDARSAANNINEVNAPRHRARPGRGGMRQIIEGILRRMWATGQLQRQFHRNDDNDQNDHPHSPDLSDDRKLKQHASCLEDMLYKSAMSLEDYYDRNTLQLRVWNATQRRAAISARRAREASARKEREASSSANQGQVTVEVWVGNHQGSLNEINQGQEEQRQLYEPQSNPELQQRLHELMRQYLQQEATMRRIFFERVRAREEYRERLATGRGVWKRIAGGRLMRN
mmetsp:Transcript_14803/g.30230  ORF Transcript_14803/g.30230 Transcript_14803/m.30230 type:complete len:258 (-) Transcript_14803:159-932(-)